LKRQLRKVVVPVLLFCFIFTIFASASVAVAAVPADGSALQTGSSAVVAKPGDYGSFFKFFQRRPQPTPTPTPTPTPQPEPQPVPAPTPMPEPQPTPQPTPTPEPQPDQGQVQGLSADEQLMLDLINQERAKAGVAPLKADLRMVQSARVKSKDMIDNNYFSHTSATLGSFATLIRKYAPDYSYLGENLAGNRTVQAAHTALMNSKGHRKNILNPNYTHIGVGIVNGGPYGKMFTQHFGG